ncbi:MAG: efflux RND transporter periplasmic adaptor subunit [Hyphomonadaceae bacterium]|nr:efflux RND transporter periplasmic adaptor subunit [Hyphomonadaceae bacterium]
MNKMDFDMPNIVEEPADNRRALLLRRAMVVGAPIGVIGLGVIGAIVLAATGPKPDKNKEPPKPVAVQVATAHARQTTISVSAQGEARPRVQSALAAQVAGRIVWISPSYIEGGSFRANEPIVRIDDADYRLAVVRAQAQVAEAQQALDREEAEGDLARQDWEQLGQGREASPLTLRQPQLAQARAGLAAARAQLRGAQLDLDRTRISAPFAGRVRARRANIGDYVAPGTPVADVFSTDVMEVRVPLTDADLASLNAQLGFGAEGDNAPHVDLTANVGGQQRQWAGRLTRVDATVDPRTRLTYGVVEVRDPFATSRPAPLAPGIFVTASIAGARSENLVAAPRGALKRNEYVYVVGQGDVIDVRTIRPAQTTATEVLFRAGLRDGERVVVSHLPSPRDGMKVTPIARAGEPPAQQQKQRT